MKKEIQYFSTNIGRVQRIIPAGCGNVGNNE
jgi:hypothetical protein